MEKESRDRFWELAAGRIHGENSQAEDAELNELLKEEENSTSLQKAQKAFQDLHKTAKLSEVSRDRSWEKINHHIREKRILSIMSVVKIAAVLVLAFLLGNLIPSVWTPKPVPEQLTEITVPLGQMSELTLCDGTQVWLNSGTKLTYSNKFGDKNRNIALEGQAFFKVTHSDIPFKVALKNCEIEVLGTSFNASSYLKEDASYVTLVEGSVKINSLTGQNITTIKPSQQITVPDNLQGIRVRNVDAGFYYSWIEGKIVFDEALLEDVIFQLEQWYNVDIMLKGKGIGDLRFSGTILKSKPIDQILKVIRLLLPVSIDYRVNPQNQDVIIISK